jgi:hypothetical protein
MDQGSPFTRSLRWHWAAWRILELSVAATVLAHRDGDEFAAFAAYKVARATAQKLALPTPVLEKMKLHAAADLDQRRKLLESRKKTTRRTAKRGSRPRKRQED